VRGWEVQECWQLPSEDFDDSISSSADDQAAILTPHHSADTFSTHDAVTRHHLRTNTLL